MFALKTFLSEALVPYETDEVTRLIIDSHDPTAFAAISHLTVGEFRDFLLSDLSRHRRRWPRLRRRSRRKWPPPSPS